MRGLTRGTSRSHIARAALESIAFQCADVLQAMQKHSGEKLAELRVDAAAGGPVCLHVLTLIPQPAPD